MDILSKFFKLMDSFIPSSIREKEVDIVKYQLIVQIFVFSFLSMFIWDSFNLFESIGFTKLHIYFSYIAGLGGLASLWYFKNFIVPVNIYLLCVTVSCTYIAFVKDGIMSPSLYWFTLLPVTALLMVGRKTAISWAFILVLDIGFIYFFKEIETIGYFGKTSYLINILLMGVSGYILVDLFWKNQKDLLAKIKKQDKILNSRKFAELELQALQSQMNPHFIFNSLQAIQDFVAGKDEKTANKYMSNFSKLMRLFLESSKEKYISLEEEVEMLQLYIELEQLRFEPPFDYQIDCPESIDWGSIELPSMLLQPFVENAINHGLKYKNGKGFLQIKIREQEEGLFIQIIDNGVGVKKAMEIKKEGTHSYKSRSTGIIEERLKTMQFVDNIQIDIQTKDRASDEMGGGTIVEILCPLLDD